jgi:hypothetical protein
MATKNPASAQGEGFGRTPTGNISLEYGSGGRAPKNAPVDEGVKEGTTVYSSIKGYDPTNSATEV